jgi:hypothetical protein
MPDTKAILLKLTSVPLTREKQIPVEEEIIQYGKATNWVIKRIVKDHLSRQSQILDAIQEEFVEQFDSRPSYLMDVIRSAGAEISRHRKLAMTIRSMRDKTPYFKVGRAIFSQPLVKISDKALLLTLADRTKVPIPYDKFSRNKNAEKLATILKGEPAGPDATGKLPSNKRYGRIRLTWNNEGFVNIDIRAKLPEI